MKSLVLKAYLAREKTPTFFENNFPRQEDLQGGDREVTLEDIERWAKTERKIKEDFAEELVRRAEERFARKSKKSTKDIKFKGRDKIMRTIDDNSEVRFDEEVQRTRKLTEKFKYPYKRMVISTAIKKAESPEKLADTAEDVIDEIARIREELPDKPKTSRYYPTYYDVYSASQEAIDLMKGGMKVYKSYLKSLGYSDSKIKQLRNKYKV